MSRLELQAMLDPTSAFSLAGPLVMAGWAALLVSLFVPPVRPYAWPTAQLAIPALFAVAYILLILEGMGAEGGGFGSIEEIRALFANDAALVAGWLHYLAFDLFVGAWIVRDGLARDIAGLKALLLVPCLALTFLFGPAGLLLYLLIRLPLTSRPISETVS
jgi:hypothetical protein